MPPTRPAGPAVPAARRSCRHLGGRRAAAEQEQVGVLEGRVGAARLPSGAASRRCGTCPCPCARTRGRRDPGRRPATPVRRRWRRGRGRRRRSRTRPPSRTIDAIAEGRHVLGLVGGQQDGASVPRLRRAAGAGRPAARGRGRWWARRAAAAPGRRAGPGRGRPGGVARRTGRGCAWRDTSARSTRSSTRRTSSWRDAAAVHSFSTAM